MNANSLGAEGAKALADALKDNPSLRFLLLQDNNLGDDGGKAIVEALKVNATL